MEACLVVENVDVQRFAPSEDMAMQTAESRDVQQCGTAPEPYISMQLFLCVMFGRVFGF